MDIISDMWNALIVGADIGLKTHGKRKEKAMNCDKCIHYHWYYDYCDKWKCKVDAREVHNCCYTKVETTLLDFMVGKEKRMTNLDRIRRMDADKMTVFLERMRINDIDYSMTFCSMCEQAGCEECIKWWLELDVKDDDYFCVDFQNEMTERRNDEKFL